MTPGKKKEGANPASYYTHQIIIPIISHLHFKVTYIGTPVTFPVITRSDGDVWLLLHFVTFLSTLSVTIDQKCDESGENYYS